MTWVKLDDQFFAHPKVIDLGKDAKLLYLAGLAYCSEHLTDGRISPAALRMVAAMVDVPQDGAAGELVRAGLWETVDAGYQVHDYLDHQPPAYAVRQRREDARERMRLLRGEANTGEGSQNVRANGVDSSHEVRRLEVDIEVPLDVEEDSSGQIPRRDDEAEDAAPSARAAAAAPAAPPEAVQVFHARLVGANGYDPSPAFLQKVAAKYGHLDLEEEALKLLSWLQSAKNRRKQTCTTGFVLKWLGKATDPETDGSATGQPRASPPAPLARKSRDSRNPRDYFQNAARR